jgi:hypothetical protein
VGQFAWQPRVVRDGLTTLDHDGDAPGDDGPAASRTYPRRGRGQRSPNMRIAATSTRGTSPRGTSCPSTTYPATLSVLFHPDYGRRCEHDTCVALWPGRAVRVCASSAAETACIQACEFHRRFCSNEPSIVKPPQPTVIIIEAVSITDPERATVFYAIEKTVHPDRERLPPSSLYRFFIRPQRSNDRRIHCIRHIVSFNQQVKSDPSNN